ncbi:MAG: beta-lactamase family protein [Oscillospiraceae bacterium]|nr:beta-lactamase family protein [Oscillospiraceae bacterium]
MKKVKPEALRILLIVLAVTLVSLSVVFVPSITGDEASYQKINEAVNAAISKQHNLLFGSLYIGSQEYVTDTTIGSGPGTDSDSNTGSSPGSNPDSNSLSTPELTPEPKPEDIVIDIAEKLPELKDSLDAMAKRYSCIAVSLAYFDGDAGEYYLYQYGYANTRTEQKVNADTTFRIASLSKLMTVICAMTLVDAGLLDLDEDISVYLGYQVKNPNYTNTPITSRMLMQHTSSIHDSDVFQTSLFAAVPKPLRQLVESRSSFQNRRPGSQFEYSNFGISVLAAICEHASGEMLDSLARRAVFDKLEIDAAFVPKNLKDTSNIAVIYNHTHRQIRNVESQLEVVDSDGILGHDHNIAQGGLTISMLDFAKILAMLGNDGEIYNDRILSADAVHAINDANVNGPGYKQGLATRLVPGFTLGEDEGFYYHTGSAWGVFAQYLYTADDTNRGIIVLTTGASTGRLSNGMHRIGTDFSRLVWEELN